MPFIQEPDITRKLARRFGIDGPSPAPTLAPEVVPVVLVSDLTEPAEEDSGYLRRCIGVAQNFATAAEYSHCQIYNPEASGLMVEPETALVSMSAAGGFQLRWYDTALSEEVTNTGFRDRRLEGQPVAEMRRDDLGAEVGTLVGRGEIATASDSILIPLDFMLPPSKGLLFVCSDANVTLMVSWYWSERGLASGEGS